MDETIFASIFISIAVVILFSIFGNCERKYDKIQVKNGIIVVILCILCVGLGFIVF